MFLCFLTTTHVFTAALHTGAGAGAVVLPAAVAGRGITAVGVGEEEAPTPKPWAAAVRTETRSDFLREFQVVVSVWKQHIFLKRHQAWTERQMLEYIKTRPQFAISKIDYAGVCMRGIVNCDLCGVRLTQVPTNSALVRHCRGVQAARTRPHSAGVSPPKPAHDADDVDVLHH